VYFLQYPINYPFLVDWRLGFFNGELRGFGEGRGFTQSLWGLSPLIPTKTLEPNKALVQLIVLLVVQTEICEFLLVVEDLSAFHMNGIIFYVLFAHKMS
jgi:hypothetical protein